MAAGCWYMLDVINSIISCGLREHAWEPYTSPLIHDAPFEQPQRLHQWMLHCVISLEKAERVLYSPSSSVEAQHTAHEQLLQLSTRLQEVQLTASKWGDGCGGLLAPDPDCPDHEREPDPSMVLAFSKHWLGHVPWSLSLPSSQHTTAQEAVEALRGRQLLCQIACKDCRNHTFAMLMATRQHFADRGHQCTAYQLPVSSDRTVPDQPSVLPSHL